MLRNDTELLALRFLAQNHTNQRYSGDSSHILPEERRQGQISKEDECEGQFDETVSST